MEVPVSRELFAGRPKLVPARSQLVLEGRRCTLRGVQRLFGDLERPSQPEDAAGQPVDTAPGLDTGEPSEEVFLDAGDGRRSGADRGPDHAAVSLDRAGLSAELDDTSSSSGRGSLAADPEATSVASSVPPGGLSTKPAHGRLLLLLFGVLALVVRWPVLANAARAFTSDEAVQALVVLRMFEHGELRFAPWDQSYIGLVEGLLAVPWTWLLGFRPLAFKLAAVCGLWLLLVAVFLLGRRLAGTTEGLLAALLLVAFSPQVVLWSTLAAGGYMLIVAWGTIALLLLPRVDGRQSSAGYGLFLGVGLFTYELFLVYLALLTPLAARFAIGFLRRPGVDGPGSRERAVRGALFLCGFAVGWSHKLAALALDSVGSSGPAYGFASPGRVLDNLRLFGRCLPALIGINPAGDPEVAGATGIGGGLGATVVGAAIVVLLLVAWTTELVRRRHDLVELLFLRPGPVRLEALLVLLVPLTCAAFVLSGNPADVLSNRYLLPILTSLPLFVASLLTRVWRWHRAAASLLLVALLASQLVATVGWYRSQGYLAAGLDLRREPHPLEAVLDRLEERGIQGAYGTYWTSYVATFLRHERFVVAPYDDWNRFPPYKAAVDRERDVAWIYRREDPRRQWFLRRLASLDRVPEVEEIGDFLVYTSADGERLLPPTLDLRVVPLADPRAEIAALVRPSEARAGSMLRIPVRLTHRSDAFWSATGVGTGQRRVAAAYRWFGPDGQAVVAEGERSLLPRDVLPGESLEMLVTVAVPTGSGPFRLVLTLVQENVAWFDQASGSADVLPIEVLRSEEE